MRVLREYYEDDKIIGIVGFGASLADAARTPPLLLSTTPRRRSGYEILCNLTLSLRITSGIFAHCAGATHDNLWYDASLHARRRLLVLAKRC